MLQSDADAQHLDVFLASRDDGQLAVVGEASVFAGALAAPFLDGQDVVHLATTNPGFASLNPSFLPDGYAPLPPASGLSFSLLSFPLNGLPAANVWYWDGVDLSDDGDLLADIAFSPLDSESAFRMYRGPLQMQFLTSGVADGGDSDQPGFTLADTTQGGGLHFHPGYEVFGPATTPPEQGVYLVSLGLQMENLLDSKPLYLVLRTDEIGTAASDAARKWLNSNALVTGSAPGDFNSDGVVDAADYTVWRDGIGIDYATSDYEVWRSNFGFTDSPGGSSTSVPEPSSLAVCLPLWLLGAAGVARSRVRLT